MDENILNKVMDSLEGTSSFTVYCDECYTPIEVGVVNSVYEDIETCPTCEADITDLVEIEFCSR